jgi:aspartyl-tRNA synthetase
MKRTLAEKTPEIVGKKATVKGWVHSRRDHGGLIFIDMRDHTGVVQLTIDADSDAFSIAEGLRDEYVIEAHGSVAERDDELKNDNIPTGGIEIMVESLKVLNKSEALPFQVNTTQNISEENRLKYRFLDLRREKMQQMLKKRALMYRRIHDFMDSQEFIEVQTPILANSSPEGARDFLVPSRLHPGQFYALPQAPASQAITYGWWRAPLLPVGCMFPRRRSESRQIVRRILSARYGNVIRRRRRRSPFNN